MSSSEPLTATKVVSPAFATSGQSMANCRIRKCLQIFMGEAIADVAFRGDLHNVVMCRMTIAPAATESVSSCATELAVYFSPSHLSHFP